MNTPMLDPSHPLLQLVRQDKRYKLEGYIFVFEALSYAQTALQMGRECPSEETRPSEEEEDQPERHVTGQELCEAIRRYALEQFGFMAKTVLDSWGIRCTGDFGEIVFNLIRIRQMRKTPQDRREDFDDVYDFQTAFREEFRIRPSETA
jgi:uncharacterized repeat protein (TIGR04138 family)